MVDRSEFAHVKILGLMSYLPSFFTVREYAFQKFNGLR